MFSVIDLYQIEDASNSIWNALDADKNLPLTLEVLKQNADNLSKIKFSSTDFNVFCSGITIREFSFRPNPEKEDLGDALIDLGFQYGKYLRPTYVEENLATFTVHFMLSVLMPNHQINMKLSENDFSIFDKSNFQELLKSDKSKATEYYANYKTNHKKDMERLEDIVPILSSFFGIDEIFIKQRLEDFFLVNM